MDVAERIVAERIVVRRPVPADAPALFAYRSQAGVCRYLPFEPQTLEQIAERIAAARAGESADMPMWWKVIETPDAVIGDVVLFLRSREHRSAEIGYVLNPRFGGRGYATEACRALLDVAFGTLGLHRVTARLDARNDDSARMCRRLGMRQEAHLVENEWTDRFGGEWSDELVFALLDREWLASTRTS